MPKMERRKPLKQGAEAAAQIMVNGKPYEVSPLGDLSLLALGHVGLMAWREARMRQAEAHAEAKANKEG